MSGGGRGSKPITDCVVTSCRGDTGWRAGHALRWAFLPQHVGQSCCGLDLPEGADPGGQAGLTVPKALAAGVGHTTTLAQATTSTQDGRTALRSSGLQAVGARVPEGRDQLTLAPAGSPTPYRGERGNSFLDLREDHVTVDISGCTLVEHLPPGARGEQGTAHGAEPALP